MAANGTPMLLTPHPFEVALAARARRKALRLRQSEVARAAGVSRDWLIDLEHGKPTCELGKVLRTFEALGIELHVTMLARPPAWTVPLTAAAEARRAHLAAARLRPRTPRKDVTPAEDYPYYEVWKEKFGD